jgi:hypothetical protein
MEKGQRLLVALAILVILVNIVVPRSKRPNPSSQGNVTAELNQPPASKADASEDETSARAAYMASLIESGDRNPDVCRQLLELTQKSEDPKLLASRVVDKLSISSLTNILLTQFGLKEEDLQGLTYVRAYAKNLAAAAMDGVIGVRDNPPPAAATTTASFSDYASLSPNFTVTSFTNFSASTRKIYATIPLVSGQQSAVLAKWYRQDHPEIFSMVRHAIPAGSDAATIWMLNTNGWDPGHYVLSVYAVDDQSTPISSGEFSVQ